MAVYSSNLIIKTGTTFEQVFTLEDGVSNSPINLTNFGVAAQMRKHAGAVTGIMECVVEGMVLVSQAVTRT